MQAKLNILDEDFVIDCAPEETRRLEDLAAALDTRLKSFDGNASEKRRLVITALALMDVTQATSAALARARCEIERLTDMVVAARLEAAKPAEDAGGEDRGRVGALRRVAEGAA